MSFIKSLFLAIVATLFLTYLFGMGLIEMLNVDVYMDEKIIDPIKAISFSALMVVLIVFVALAIVMSIFGSIIFITLLAFGALAMVALGVFWPIFLVAIVIWLFSSKRNLDANA